MNRDQFLLDIHHELIIDNFAGGGGASTGIEMALGRCVDIAVNHDPEAVAMHAINHPQTQHYCESVWDVDPDVLSAGRPIGLAWFSPDCKHFSKAKGSKPRDKKIRGLAWVVLRWVARPNKPRVIILENVEEFRSWGPLLDNGKPCPKNKGRTFNSFINALQRHGYQVEHRELRACDYGTPTIRKRLFLIARCDGARIVWPTPTHGHPDSADVRNGKRLPYLTAGQNVIDWRIPCPSIFERTRPLAPNTLRRIARGIERYVLQSAKPFIVKVNHDYDYFRGQALCAPMQTITATHGYGLVAPVLTECANASHQRTWTATEPLRTICAEVKGGHHAFVGASLVQTGYGEREGQAPRALDPDKPLGTVVAQAGKHAVTAATLIKHYGGHYSGAGVDPAGPLHTATTTDHHAVVAANLARQFGKSNAAAADAPVGAITAGGSGKTQLVASSLAKLPGSPPDGLPLRQPAGTVTGGDNHLAEVRAFLVKYYSEGGQDQSLHDPAHTIPTKDRMGLVTVAGVDYQIIDIGMRMLEPHELYAAQGFPPSYVIAPVVNGRKLPKHAQVRMAGNSVCPPLAAALVRANCADLAAQPPQPTRPRQRLNA